MTTQSPAEVLRLAREALDAALSDDQPHITKCAEAIAAIDALPQQDAQHSAPSGEPAAADILGAVARGWTHPKTSSLVMDPDLAIAIAAEVHALYTGRSPTAPAPLLAFDILAHLKRQADFSAKTFGPGARVEGVTDHIAKELAEVRESGGDLAEWVDVIILAFDGALRSGAGPAQIIDAMVAKQTKNEGRKWPDWRTAPAGKAIEHDRTGEASAAPLMLNGLTRDETAATASVAGLVKFRPLDTYPAWPDGVPEVSGAVPQAVTVPATSEGPDFTAIAFEAWWKRHGEFIRAGGGDYEKCFAWGAWKAAAAIPCECEFKKQHSAAAAPEPVASDEHVAEVMSGWVLAWAGSEPIAHLLARHPSVRIGSKLYTHPAPAVAEPTAPQAPAANPAGRVLGSQQAMIYDSAIPSGTALYLAPPEAPARQGLTDAQILGFAEHAADRIPCSQYECRVVHAVRMAEAAHGITLADTPAPKEQQ